VCVFFQLWSFENYNSKFIPHLRNKISCSFSPSPSTHFLLPSSSYPWLPMVVSFFLTHLLLEVASPIIFLCSPFHCHSSSRRKGLHWWRIFKAYKLHMELHHVLSRASSSRWCSFASSIFLFGQFTLIPCSSSYFPCISSIFLWFGVVYITFTKINRLNLRSTVVLAFLLFKFYRSTLKSYFCVDFRFYHFSVIIFLCWTFGSKFSSKILIRKETQKSKSKSLNPCCLRVMFNHNNCHIMF